jgi:hypothetical protein
LKEIIEIKEAEDLKEVEEVFMGSSPEVMGNGRRCWCNRESMHDADFFGIA